MRLVLNSMLMISKSSYMVTSKKTIYVGCKRFTKISAYTPLNTFIIPNVALEFLRGARKALVGA